MQKTNYSTQGISPCGEDLDLPLFLEQTKGGGFFTLRIRRSTGIDQHTLYFRPCDKYGWVLHCDTLKERKGQTDISISDKLKASRVDPRIRRLIRLTRSKKVRWMLWGHEWNPLPQDQCFLNLLCDHGWTLRKGKEVNGSCRHYVRRPGQKWGSHGIINARGFSSFSSATSMGTGHFSFLDLWKHFKNIK